jgi:hypothetical protein
MFCDFCLQEKERTRRGQGRITTVQICDRCILTAMQDLAEEQDRAIYGRMQAEFERTKPPVGAKVEGRRNWLKRLARWVFRIKD